MDNERKQRILRILEERTSINSETGCWEWQGVLSDGYGQVRIDNILYKVHRLSAEIFLGYLPEIMTGLELHILHKNECKSRACWNFHHLYIGTPAQNALDRIAAGNTINQNTNAIHCKHGHELTENNTYNYFNRRDGKMQRGCRECRRVASLKQEEKRRTLRLMKKEVG